MANFRARQIAAITDAIAATRLALRPHGPFDPLSFAQIYVAEGGVQIPDEADNNERAARVGEELLAVLRGARAAGGDPDVLRELARVRQEAFWLENSLSERVVGFRLCLSEAQRQHPNCKALLKDDRGLGAGVYRKHDIVVLRPECGDATFEPVYADELEC